MGVHIFITPPDDDLLDRLRGRYVDIDRDRLGAQGRPGLAASTAGLDLPDRISDALHPRMRVTFQGHDPRGFHNHDPGVPRPIQIFSHPG